MRVRVPVSQLHGKLDWSKQVPAVLPGRLASAPIEATCLHPVPGLPLAGTDISGLRDVSVTRYPSTDGTKKELSINFKGETSGQSAVEEKRGRAAAMCAEPLCGMPSACSPPL